ncbi:unnamed protein product [Schistocephalus solidus]|uniref:PDZ domain-containing protein n=1 Tax=Schistocephalus solidus TaxID=70667 RepID=A0A183SII0_SCHSO|nr:unnamed protein product [Schistocephalus solidus]
MTHWKPRLGVAGATGRPAQQKRVSQWTRNLPEAPAVQLQSPSPPRLHIDPVAVGAHGTVPSLPRLIDLPQFRLRRRGVHPPQSCQPAPHLEPGGLTPLATSTKPPTKAFRLQLARRFSRRSLPFRPFLWRREKPENEPLSRINKRNALQCKPLRKFATRKRISLPPIFKENADPDDAAKGEQVVQSTIHLPNTADTSTSDQCFRYVHIHREDENTPFGIFVKKGNYGFVITRVPEKCPLRLGDEIVEINGIQCPDMSLSWLVCHLQSSTSIRARVVCATSDQP